MSSNFFKDTQNSKGVSLFGSNQCPDGTGVSSFKIQPSPAIDIDSSLGSEFEIGLNFGKDDLQQKFLDLACEVKNDVEKSEISLATTFTESSKSNETRPSLNSCTDASITEHEIGFESRKCLNTGARKTKTLCLFNQPKSNKTGKTEKLSSTTKKEIKKLSTPRVLDTIQLEERSKAKTKSALNGGVSETPLRSQISGNFLAVSFSELIGQVEATKYNLEKELELTRRKLLKVEAEKLEKEQYIKNLSDVNSRTKSQVEALFKHVTQLDSDFNDLRHDKDKAEKKYQKIKDDTNRYKTKVGEFFSTLDELKQSMNSIRMQMQVHFKVKELELQQKDVQLDEMSGLLSEEKIRLAEMQKISFDLSKLESKILELCRTLVIDISGRFSNEIKQAIGSENLNSSLEDKFAFVEKEFKNFISTSIASKIAELEAAIVNKDQNLSLLVCSEFQKAAALESANHLTTREQLLIQIENNIGLMQKKILDDQELRLDYDQKLALLESEITQLERAKVQLESELSSHKTSSHDRILHLTGKLNELEQELTTARQKVIECDSTAEKLLHDLLNVQEELKLKNALLNEKDAELCELQKNFKVEVAAFQSKTSKEKKEHLLIVESRNCLLKEAEVLKMVIRSISRDYEICQKVKADNDLERDKWKIKYDDMKLQNNLLMETLKDCFAQNQETNDTVSQLIQQHKEQLNIIKKDLEAEHKNSIRLEQANLKLQSEIQSKELAMKPEESITYCKRMFDVFGEALKNEEALTKGLGVQIKDISEFMKSDSASYKCDLNNLNETLSSLKIQLKHPMEVSSFRFDNSCALGEPKQSNNQQLLLPRNNQNLRANNPTAVMESSAKLTQRIKGRKKKLKSQETEISQESHKMHRIHTSVDSNSGANYCKDTILSASIVDHKKLNLTNRNSKKTLNKQNADDVFSLSHITSSPPSKKSKKK